MSRALLLLVRYDAVSAFPRLRCPSHTYYHCYDRVREVLRLLGRPKRSTPTNHRIDDGIRSGSGLRYHRPLRTYGATGVHSHAKWCCVQWLVSSETVFLPCGSPKNAAADPVLVGACGITSVVRMCQTRFVPPLLSHESLPAIDCPSMCRHPTTE